MFKSSSAKARILKAIRPSEVDGAKRPIGDDGNAFRLLALLYSTVEFLCSEPWIALSQAKRVLARIERFRTVAFDFLRVSYIGPALADEIFRESRTHTPEFNCTSSTPTRRSSP